MLHNTVSISSSASVGRGSWFVISTNTLLVIISYVNGVGEFLVAGTITEDQEGETLSPDYLRSAALLLLTLMRATSLSRPEMMGLHWDDVDYMNPACRSGV